MADERQLAVRSTPSGDGSMWSIHTTYDCPQLGMRDFRNVAQVYEPRSKNPLLLIPAALGFRLVEAIIAHVRDATATDPAPSGQQGETV